MREVLRAFQEAVTSEIARLGYVAKLMGDGVLAYFGWPRAHEDDPERAVGGTGHHLYSRPTGNSWRELACRVGIATGLVVVGDLIGNGAAQEHAVVGLPQSGGSAARGRRRREVVIAATTRRLLGSSFAVEAAGERRLKGYEHPVPVFRVLRQEPHESRFLARREELGQIVGRETELAALRQAWQQAKSGRGHTVLLTGEAGIGKSRLSQALEDAIAEDMPAKQVFQCSPLHSDNPLWPVAQQSARSAAIVQAAMGYASAERRPIARETVDASGTATGDHAGRAGACRVRGHPMGRSRQNRVDAPPRWRRGRSAGAADRHQPSRR
jgi:hypothetical protein